ncbi:hypothetical protein ACJX0J_037388, partial [Zea mays]
EEEIIGLFGFMALEKDYILTPLETAHILLFPLFFYLTELQRCIQYSSMSATHKLILNSVFSYMGLLAFEMLPFMFNLSVITGVDPRFLILSYILYICEGDVDHHSDTFDHNEKTVETKLIIIRMKMKPPVFEVNSTGDELQ